MRLRMLMSEEDRFNIPELKLPNSDSLPLKLQLEELEFLRDRYKEKQLKLTSLQVAQIYIRIANLKEDIKKQDTINIG